MYKLIIASGPVIIKDNKVLLEISGEDDFWKFIGGRVKEGENLRQAASRRSKEAMGVDVSLKDEEPYLMYVAKPGDEKVDVLLVHWLSDFEGEIMPGPDTRKWDWHDKNNLPQNLAPNIIPALKYFKII